MNGQLIATKDPERIKVYRYKCPICYELHNCDEDARYCCQDLTWRCDACHRVFSSEHEADNCCPEAGLQL